MLISNYNSKDATVLESDGKEMEGVLFQGRHLLDKVRGSGDDGRDEARE